MFVGGVAGHLIIQDDERAMDGGARRVESPMRTGRPCMALFYVDLHESTGQSPVLLCHQLISILQRFFCGRGSKTSGPHPAIYLRTVLMFQHVSTISRKTWKTQESNTNTESPSVETPSFVLSDTPNNCFKTQPEACHHIVRGFVPTGRVEDVEIPAPLRPHG